MAKSSFRDKVAANAERQKSQGSMYGYLKLADGIPVFDEEADTTINLDFIPYEVTDPNHLDRDNDQDCAVPGSLWYRKPILVHRSVGAMNISLICPKTIGKKCPICEHRAARAKDGADQEELKTMNYSKRSLYLIVPRDVKKTEEVLHVWDISDHCFQKQLNTELGETPENGIFPDPEEGLTLKVRLVEDSFGKNKYAKCNRIDFKERDPIEKSIMKNVPNLDEMITVLSYEEIYNKFHEIEETPKKDDDGKEEKEERGSRRRDRDEDKKEEDRDEDRGSRRREREKEKEEDKDEDRSSRRRNRDKDEDEDKDKDKDEDRGSRRRREKEADDDDDKGKKKDKDEDEDKGSSRRRDKEKDKGEELECPVEDGAFGVKTDDFKACDKCKIWNQCSDARERNEKKGKK